MVSNNINAQYGKGDSWYNNPLGFEPVKLHTSMGFIVPAVAVGSRYLLDVGPVPGSALVRMNGADTGRASLPPWRVDITGALRTGRNQIEIEYRPPPRNGLIGRAIKGDPGARQFRERRDALAPAGLRGPVHIREMAAARERPAPR